MLSPGRLLYLNFRLLHRLSRSARRRLSPAGTLVVGGIVGAGIFGIDTRASLAYQVFSLLLVLILIAAIASLFRRDRYQVRRVLPEYATVNEPLSYRLIVDNPNASAVQDLVLIDELDETFPAYEDFRRRRDPDDPRRNWVDRKIGYPRLLALLRQRRGGTLPGADIERIPARDRRETMIRFTPIRRGWLRFTRTTLARTEPLGLCRALQSHATPDRLLVLPAIWRVPRLHLPGQRRYQREGTDLTNASGDSQEFMSLREYRPGDPLRTIHWRSYARRGEPVVKEFRAEYQVRQGLLLDTSLQGPDSKRFEVAVSLTASWALQGPGTDTLLDLLITGERAFHLTGGPGHAESGQLLELLACVEPTRERPFDDLSLHLEDHLSALSGMILVLLEWDTPRRTLVERLLRAGLSLAVFVVTPAGIEQITDPGPLAGQGAGPWAIPVDAVQAGLDRVSSPGSARP